MSTERKTVWLNVYDDDCIVAFLELERADKAFAVENGCRIGPAVQVDLIRTAEGFKVDDRAGRIEGLKEAREFCSLYYGHVPFSADLIRAGEVINQRIAQLEQELAHDKQ